MIRLPFFKAKVSKTIFFNVCGFISIAVALIFLISFISLLSPAQDSRILSIINQILTRRFGFASIAVPFLFLMIGGLCFNVRKLKFVKAQATIGSFAMVIALMGFFSAGSWGRSITDSLTYDFTPAGSFVILFITLVVGLILFFDTSVDEVVRIGIWVTQGISHFIKNNLIRNPAEPLLPLKPEREDRFISDKKPDSLPALSAKPVVQPSLGHVKSATPVLKPISINTGENDESAFSIKPLTMNSTWVFPPLNLLADVSQKEAQRGDVKKHADIIERTLDSFGIRARVSEMNYGPSVTQYALEITMGTKLSKITALANDLALALAAPTGQVRIEAPIPGRSLVGIEIPNIRAEIVTLKQILNEAIFVNSTDPLLVPLGLDVSGKIQATSISKMPHVLIAGTTGSGKSVILNAWITTFLFRTKPEDLRMILIDPKRVELSVYNGIPHLLTEVIVDPEKIIKALRWTVGEMESRYKIFAEKGARNLEGYNTMPGVEKKPYILFVIDELADLMMFAPGDAEELITRIAQMARATGIHLILATQRPSVDVITGLMKANIPTRLAFNVTSMIDSRVIIDTPGAEKLLGKGDMLFLPPDQAKPRRIQGPLVTDKEVQDVVAYMKAQVPVVHYTEEITKVDSTDPRTGLPIPGNQETDEFFSKALSIVTQEGKASTSLLQRRLSIGYSRAARLVDQLEAAGYVGRQTGSKAREIIKRNPISETAPIEQTQREM